MSEKKANAEKTGSPAEGAADLAPTFKPLAECCELNQAGVDVSEDIAHYLKEAIDEYGQLGAECADLYFLYGDNMLRLAQIAGKDSFKAELRRKKDAREGSAHAASASSSDNANSAAAAAPDLQEVNELFEISWENLDVARVIYERDAKNSEDPEQKLRAQKKLAATYIRLGDNSCERILIDPGVELYQQALQLRTALKLSPALIAETNMCIGNAYTYKEQYATAKTFFSIAKDTLAGDTDAAEMLADLDKKIRMCSVGNLNIVPDSADADTAHADSAHADTAVAANTSDEAVASPTTRKREDIEAKIASATVVQVRKKKRVN